MRDLTKALLFVCGILGIVIYDAVNYDGKRQELLAQASSALSLELPKRAPIPSQKDIDLAMKIFSIRTHKYVVGPTYNERLFDRGITQGYPDSPLRKVEIGPSAFSSWGMLGSTLAHEIEVHANQSFMKIMAQDAAMPGSPGTRHAEIEAYSHELKCKDRFGLSNTEVWLIKETLKEFYGSAASH